MSRKVEVTATRLRSRAVTRHVQAGEQEFCPYCREMIRFRPRYKTSKVICNVYVGGNWDRVEHYHQDCYADIGEPYGAPDVTELDYRRNKKSR